MTSSREDIEHLYISERSRLERVALRRVGEAHAADIVQDVFAALWSRAVEHITLTPAYLSRATKYGAISHFRAEQRKRKFFGAITEEQYSVPVATPDQIVSARQDLQRLAETIHTLPARTRQIFILNRLHNCTYDEIAESLGLSYSTVEREIARAIVACKACQ
ncbi:sigma-70 family RNA polymerase sigma factor [Mesorhizobium sp. CGMCC 1.15528]|uniref:Sigma-70 family RNA polymerase sigma factor n=1 Tax=Mesorhizobium zhangyense TaxID=1776730 RepID=A0A7C9V7Y0_9HYPH|nr:sigma-70 family RNA polymerase sigma factor [Mesorhizobium zhangyense]NGN43065.1 sigma-70 family RNA polymerase sigma factor [Mesorhizobium zhangyense]